MLLETITQSLEVLLAGAVAANQLPVVVNYNDGDTRARPVVQHAQTNGVTAVTIVTAPTSKVHRTVTFMSVFNADTAAATVTIRLNDNSVMRTIYKVALEIGDNLIYTEKGGFDVTDKNGKKKTVDIGRLQVIALEGEQGEQGDPGVPGIQGPPGIQGLIGPPGFDADETDSISIPGPKGDAGATGATGAAGAQGIQGIMGPPGTGTDDLDEPLIIPGPKGDTGATGAQGAQGNPGATGATGSQGPMGPPGMDADEPELPQVIPSPSGSATSPGGSNTQVQYNNSGAFGGSANLVFDGADLILGSGIRARMAGQNRVRFLNSMVKVTTSAATSMINNAYTSVAFGAEIFDTDGLHDNVTNNTRLTAALAGKYLIIGTLGYTSNATGQRTARIRINGISTANEVLVGTNPAGVTAISIATIYILAVGDYVELQGYQDSGGAINNDTSFLEMVYIGE